MTKINVEIGKGPPALLSAQLTVLVGVLVDGKPDFVTVAAIGVAASNPPALTIALQPHRYSLKGIRQNMTFSVNVPSTNLLKETDYCGIASGAKTDKVKDCNFSLFYGKVKTAPLIEQCPINHACEVIQEIYLGSHYLIIGRVVETHLTQECLTEGRLDVTKIKPFFFGSRKYFVLGEFIAEPFKAGNEIKPV
jgi:flavin reductase (DIM6/NTAB) family NADH-FMN oxidoreductase RutF